MKSSAFTKILPALLLIAIAVSGSGYAAGGNYSSDVDLRPIMALLEDGQYESAIDQLHDELDVDPDNPDIMSLLGFSYRKNPQFRRCPDLLPVGIESGTRPPRCKRIPGRTLSRN